MLRKAGGRLVDCKTAIQTIATVAGIAHVPRRCAGEQAGIISKNKQRSSDEQNIRQGSQRNSGQAAGRAKQAKTRCCLQQVVIIGEGLHAKSGWGDCAKPKPRIQKVVKLLQSQGVAGKLNRSGPLNTFK